MVSDRLFRRFLMDFCTAVAPNLRVPRQMLRAAHGVSHTLWAPAHSPELWVASSLAVMAPASGTDSLLPFFCTLQTLIIQKK